jgi:cell wall-associated NlpC family hydrolase
MSSGLVASVGLPAEANTPTASGPEPATPVAAPAAAPAGAAFTTALLSAPAAYEATTPVAAPVTARVAFETGTFKALPKPAPAPVVEQAAAGTGDSAVVSQSSSTRSSDSGTASSSSESSTQAAPSAKGSSVLAIAARYIGVPYRYGGTTPGGGWDCSGSVRYIYKQVGVSLPRTANQQMQATTRVSRSKAKPGDLVFFVSGGRATHMGIYAGRNMMYDAGRSGRSFSKREIYSSDVVFGRV